MNLEKDKLDLIQNWNEAKEQVKRWTQTENDLRDKVIKGLFDSGTIEGTETIQIGSDWKLKATRRLNYTLSNKDGALVSILQTLPSVIAENLIRWSPDLNLSMYRKLDATTQQLFIPVLSIKPAKPSLELVPPNANASTVHESD